MRGELCRRQVLSFTCCVFCGEFENNVEHLFSCTIARVVWCLLRMMVFWGCDWWVFYGLSGFSGIKLHLKARWFNLRWWKTLVETRKWMFNCLETSEVCTGLIGYAMVLWDLHQNWWLSSAIHRAELGIQWFYEVCTRIGLHEDWWDINSMWRV